MPKFWYDSPMAVDPNLPDPEQASSSPSPNAPAPQPSPPTIHEAEFASGATGVVYWGAEIDFAAAVAHRQTGENVVVRGQDLRANRHLERVRL